MLLFRVILRCRSWLQFLAFWLQIWNILMMENDLRLVLQGCQTWGMTNFKMSRGRDKSGDVKASLYVSKTAIERRNACKQIMVWSRASTCLCNKSGARCCACLRSASDRLSPWPCWCVQPAGMLFCVPPRDSAVYPAYGHSVGWLQRPGAGVKKLKVNPGYVRVRVCARYFSHSVDLHTVHDQSQLLLLHWYTSRRRRQCDCVRLSVEIEAK